jgi:hypothetical protein
MDIGRFFLFVSLSPSLSTLFHHFHPTSKEQHSRLFYITHHPATNTSLNKRRSAVYVKKEFLSLCCQSPTTHTQSIFRDLPSRQCCFWKNVSAIKWASEQKEEERKTKRLFFDAGVSRWWWSWKMNERGYIHVRPDI